MPKHEKPHDYRFNNNFDFLRILAALLVILSHSYALSGNGALEPLGYLTNTISLGYIGLIMFFVISGYLISTSYHRDPSPYRYFWKRFLRIVPGLTVAVLFTIFVIGPLVTTYPLKDYFYNFSTWSYFSIILATVTSTGIFIMPQDLPGVFTNNPFPTAVNGSLWSLPVEFMMYISLFVLGLFGLIHKRKEIVFIITLMLITAYIFQLIPHFLLNMLYLMIFFMVGSLYFLYDKKVKYNIKIAFFLLIIWILSFKTVLFNLTSFICLPYLVLYIAQVPLPHLNKTGKYGDFSYGLYVYAFPIQQTIAYFIQGISVIEMFLLSFLSTLPLAILSWRYIESKALKLKKIEIEKYLKIFKRKDTNLKKSK